jgi:hypothetical protein
MQLAALNNVKYHETMRTEDDIFMEMNIGPKFQLQDIRRIRVTIILRRDSVGNI